MYSLTVCDHIMIAHSFQGEEFGPAQRMHGATYAVEAEFRAVALDHLQLLIINEIEEFSGWLRIQ